jgi:GNAT superfamily N-acetyltransferase
MQSIGSLCATTQTATVYDLAVHPDFRQYGIGAKLLHLIAHQLYNRVRVLHPPGWGCTLSRAAKHLQWYSWRMQGLGAIQPMVLRSAFPRLIF